MQSFDAPPMGQASRSVTEGARRGTLVAVLAHPDDAEIWCGGVLARHAQRGDRVVVVTFSRDTVRACEARRGAEILGVELVLLSVADYLEVLSEKHLTRVVSILEGIVPQAVITHWADDSHPAHRDVASLTHRALLCIGGSSAEETKNIAVYACDSYNSLGGSGAFPGKLYIDVSGVWTRKLEAVRAHQSQRPEQYAAMIEAQCRLHGARSGVTYAECYHRVALGGQVMAASYLW